MDHPELKLSLSSQPQESQDCRRCSKHIWGTQLKAGVNPNHRGWRNEQAWGSVMGVLASDLEQVTYSPCTMVPHQVILWIKRARRHEALNPIPDSKWTLSWWLVVIIRIIKNYQEQEFMVNYIWCVTEKAMGTHSSTLAWKIPWRTEEPGWLQFMRSRRVGHDWATSLSIFTFMHWRRKWQPTPVFLPGESQGLGSLVDCRLWGLTESEHDWSYLAAAAAIP